MQKTNISPETAQTIINEVILAISDLPDNLKEKHLPPLLNFDITTFDLSNSDDVAEVSAYVDTVVATLNTFYYDEGKITLIDDALYDQLAYDFLQQINSTAKSLHSVGEIATTKNTDFFPSAPHGIYNTNGDVIASFEAGSMNKKTINDFISQEDQNLEKEGIEATPDFSSISEFNNTKITLSDKLDGITLVCSYTDDKAKAVAHTNRLGDWHEKYIRESSKNDNEKNKIATYLKNQRKKILEKINTTSNGDHILYKIVTRGDGDIGEEITFNASNGQGFIFSIPKKEIMKTISTNKLDLVIRGEAVITETDFSTIPYKNPRNGVALIRNQEGTLSDKISFVPFERLAYDFDTKTIITADREAMFEFFNKLGFITPFFKSFTNFKDAYDAIQKRFSERASNRNFVTFQDGKKVWTDGMIISIDDAKERTALGVISKRPKGEFAFKPRPEIGIGIISGIEFSVGKTGVITPVVLLKDGVSISGSVVSRITGANEDILKEFCPFIGARVEIVKRGEIIPKIEKNKDLEPINTAIETFIIDILSNYLDEMVLKDIITKLHDGDLTKLFNSNISSNAKKTSSLFFKELLGSKLITQLGINPEFSKEFGSFLDGLIKYDAVIDKVNAEPLVYPSICPSCSSVLSKGKVLIKCLNKQCQGKQQSKLNVFAQNLTKGIGEGKINQLNKLGVLQTYSDFFKMTETDFKDKDGNWLEGWRDVSVQNFLSAVNTIRNSQDNVFFGSLFFDGIGNGKFLTLFQNISLSELRPLLNEVDTFIPDEEFSEKDTLPKVVKKLTDMKYAHIDLFNRIVSIPGFAHKSAITIMNLWAEEKEAVNNLLDTITLKPTKVIADKGNLGTIVLTGSLDSVPEFILNGAKGSERALLTDYLKREGYTVTSSVSSKTACVVAGDGATLHKVEKAKEVNVPVYTPEEFFKNFSLFQQTASTTTEKKTEINTAIPEKKETVSKKQGTFKFD